MTIWDDERFLTDKDLAAMFNRTLSSVRRDRLVRQGPPYYKIGRSIRYRRSDIEQWLKSVWVKYDGH